MTIHNHNFKALGTSIELLVVSTDPDAATEGLMAAEARVHELEQVFSRFRPDSELSRLNAAGTLRCSAELYEVIALAVEARMLTGGRFDPTIHDALVSAGYDRSFELLKAAPPTSGRPLSALRDPSRGRISLDAGTRTVRLGPGTRLDLGGIAKGWIADTVLAQLAEYGPALVNAGGDIASSMRSDDAWTVQLPGTTDGESLAFEWGAVATSGTDRRRWQANDGTVHHHVIDPATGSSSTTPLMQVTAFAPTCAEAEIRATQLLLAQTASAARSEANALGVAAIITDHRGNRYHTGELA